jgi:hypothetical protein
MVSRVIIRARLSFRLTGRKGGAYRPRHSIAIGLDHRGWIIRKRLSNPFFSKLIEYLWGRIADFNTSNFHAEINAGLMRQPPNTIDIINLQMITDDLD